MSTKSADVESRDNSPDRDGSPGKRTSKKRKVLSCFACRNRKMKCDRVYPVCGRCQKTGRGYQCTYDPRLLEDLVGPSGATASGVAHSESGHNYSAAEPTSLDSLQWKIRCQDKRILELEQALSVGKHAKAPSQYHHVQPHTPNEKEQMMFRGKGFKTSFHGATSVMSTIAQYREMQAFTREALTSDHSIRRIRSDFKTFRDRRKRLMNETGVRSHGFDEEVFAALPDRQTIDICVALYFQSCETTYRILHEPSFWKEYHVFWSRPPGSEGSAGFAVILLLIFAATKCLAPKDDLFDGDTTIDRQTASNLADICDAWNARQPRKRLTLQFFQIQCLCLLAKRINCVQLKQDWVASGDLVRLAQASGMHRDPTLLATGKVSSFEKEMKRRLWVTIVELELLSSLECGLQPSTNGLYWDTPAPSNLSDDVLSPDIRELPVSQPLGIFTPCSYLSASYRSLALRIHLTQLLNDPSERLRYEDVLDYDSQLHEVLGSLPTWNDPRATLPTFILRNQLEQFLLILHRPYAIAASTQHRYLYSFTQCIDISGKIVTGHEDLVSKGILLMNHMRNDAVRISLTLSEVVYHNCTKRQPVTFSVPQPEADAHTANLNSHFADLPRAEKWSADMSFALPVLPREPLARTLCTAGIESLQLAVLLCEKKVMRLGTAYMEFGLLSAAIDMLPPLPSSRLPATSISHITTPNDDIEVRCKKTLDRFQAVAFRVLAMQKDPGNTFATSLRTTMASVSPSDDPTPRMPNVANGPTFSASREAQDTMSQFAIPSLGASEQAGIGSKDLSGTFDNLHDMQVDMGGWNFPDFWAFDLGGDF